jgi:hypothetical protein
LLGPPFRLLLFGFDCCPLGAQAHPDETTHRRPTASTAPPVRFSFHTVTMQGAHALVGQEIAFLVVHAPPSLVPVIGVVARRPFQKRNAAELMKNQGRPRNYCRGDATRLFARHWSRLLQSWGPDKRAIEDVSMPGADCKLQLTYPPNFAVLVTEEELRVN